MKQIHGIWLPESDMHFIDHIHKNGDYQRDTFQAAMKYVAEPKIFYDIGAHVGLWSMMALKQGFEQIYAYEPNPITFKCLGANLSHYENINLHNCGVSQFDGGRKLIRESPENSGAVKLIPSISIEDGVECITLNHDNLHQLIAAYNIKACESFVKIDTEGMEAECVLGMDKILYALRPVVCVEQRTNHDALDILQKMGMQIVQQIRKDYILTWKS